MFVALVIGEIVGYSDANAKSQAKPQDKDKRRKLRDASVQSDPTTSPPNHLVQHFRMSLSIDRR